MTSALAKTALISPQSRVGEFIMAIFHHGAWKEQRIKVTLDEAEATARGVHQRTSFVVQVRNLDKSVLCQFGYPVSESDCDDNWEDEE